MNVTDTIALAKILQAIILRRPLMTTHIERIRRTEYRLKKKTFDFYPSASTTWGPYNVHLAHNFFSWTPIDQQANLIHEATHGMQHTHYGKFFFIPYLAQHFTVGYARNKFEVEAEKAERYYLLGV